LQNNIETRLRRFVDWRLSERSGQTQTKDKKRGEQKRFFRLVHKILLVFLIRESSRVIHN